MTRTTLADIAAADASAKLANPKEHLITWINDRHYYTQDLGGAALADPA